MLVSQNFSKRLNSMLAVDFRRMFTMPLVFIMIGITLVMPILILFGGDGAMAFTSAWQIIATESGGSSMAGMDMTSMCNINLVYFMVGILVCLFVAADFKSGYAKNLFTVRAKKGDYVASKTIVGFLCGALMLLAFFLGAVLGGRMAGLPFDLGGAGVGGLVMCMLAKIFLMSVFVAIFLVMSVFGKEKSWLSILLSLFGGMLLFMMIPMMSPLNSGVINVGMCLAGGVLFAIGIGAISKMILSKTSLVG